MTTLGRGCGESYPRGRSAEISDEPHLGAETGRTVVTDDGIVGDGVPPQPPVGSLIDGTSTGVSPTTQSPTLEWKPAMTASHTMMSPVSRSLLPIAAPFGLGTREDYLIRVWGMQPPTFSGVSEIDTLGDWMITLDRVFESTGCPSRYRVDFGAAFLTGAASTWWREIMSPMAERANSYSWDDFKDDLTAEIYREHALIQRRQEFSRLVQGDLSVAGYYRRFRELMGSEPSDRRGLVCLVHQFEDGFNEDVRAVFAFRRSDSLEEAFERASYYDGMLREKGKRKRSSVFEDRRDQGTDPRRGPSGSDHGRRQVRDGRSSRRAPCHYCGASHPGRTCDGQPACFRCGQPGHLKAQCHIFPLRPAIPTQPLPQYPPPPVPQGRVPATPDRLTVTSATEAERGIDVPSGTLTFFSRHTAFTFSILEHDVILPQHVP